MHKFFMLALQAAVIAAGQSFDVASIKPSAPDATGGWVRFLPGGRFAVTNCMLDGIIQDVYNVKDYQLVSNR